MSNGLLNNVALAAEAWKDVVRVGVSQLHHVADEGDLLVVACVLHVCLIGAVRNGWARLLGELSGKKTNVLHPVVHCDAVLSFAWVLRFASWLPD